MKALYLLRQKLSLTAQEIIALGSILSLLGIGFILKEFRAQDVPTVRQSVIGTAQNKVSKSIAQQGGIFTHASHVEQVSEVVADSMVQETNQAAFVPEELPAPDTAEMEAALPERKVRRLAIDDIIKADDKPKADAPVAIPRMNINTANMRQLEMLPGIGPAMAERIVAYRTQIKPFDTVEELMEIKGIGEKKFAKMLPYVFSGK